MATGGADRKVNLWDVGKGEFTSLTFYPNVLNSFNSNAISR